MDNVLTLIADPATAKLDDSTLEAADQAIRVAGGATSAPRWLDPGAACDLPFSGPAPDVASGVVASRLGTQSIDVAAMASAGRRKRLLLADMDSTIVTTETLDELAAAAGRKAEVARITALAMAGELDFAAALDKRVAMLRGLPETTVWEVATRVRLSDGARTLVATMRAHGAYAALISGGFKVFARRVAAAATFDHFEANDLEIEDGRLTGRVLAPILDRDSKLKTLLRLADDLGIPLEETAAVGDGANDLPMLRAAGLGVAYRGKPLLRAQTRFRLDHGDLTAMLFLQGYRREEFVADWTK